MSADMESQPPYSHAQPPARSGRSLLPWMLAVTLLALATWAGWRAWNAWQSRAAATANAQAGQWRALEARIDALRRDQRAQAQRITQADATNRVLRDEVIGVGQRAALLEDSVAKLADPSRHGAQALRLDEVELLLAAGAQRLQLAGDLDGARRAYVLAAGVLDGVDDPAWLDLRQALAQERTALDALGADPKTVALARLDAFAATLATPDARAAHATNAQGPWWQRVFARLVQVRPSDRNLAIAPGDRAAGFAALQLELTLARAAAERRDRNGWQAALARADAWLVRLSPPSPALRAQRARLAVLRTLPLASRMPAFGSTLRQLQAMRAAR
jgi:uroporphyrin-3 C-methyltransferase